MTQAPTEDLPPPGMVPINRPQIEAWYVPVEGRALAGYLRGFEATQYGVVALVESARDCRAKKVGASEPTTVKAGAMIAVGLRHGLKPLLSYAENTPVWIKALSRDPITPDETGRERFVWRFDVRVKEGAKVRSPHEIREDEERMLQGKARGYDDIPF